MYAICNAFFRQAELVQTNRWEEGPLEIAFLNVETNPPSMERLMTQFHAHQWNSDHAAGHIRDGETFEAIENLVPGVTKRENPNLFVAPRLDSGLSALHIMLGSLLPDRVLKNYGIQRDRAHMSLSLIGHYDMPSEYAGQVERAFAKFIWKRLNRGKRNSPAFFSEHSPLKLLAGDARFWMNRIYRLALERRETLFESVRDDESWTPMELIAEDVVSKVPKSELATLEIRRPLMGGTIWDENDEAERNSVIDDAISGAGVVDSLEPVIEFLRANRAHEDFSELGSWVKEDFERSFYSKRARLKVELVETIDDMPVWEAGEGDGYGDLLFRDLLAALDVQDQKLLVALRMGKTVGEIATQKGLAGHASVSRAVARVKRKVAALLKQ